MRWHLIFLQLFCIGTLVSAAIALSTINEIAIFDDDVVDNLPDDSEIRTDREAYRGVAGYLIFIAAAAILFHAIMIILRALYFGGILEAGFVAFAIVVSNDR